jgi:hypothetical protein
MLRLVDAGRPLTVRGVPCRPSGEVEDFSGPPLRKNRGMTEANDCPVGGAHEWGAARASLWAELCDWLARGGSWGAGYLVCQRCGSSDPLGGRYSILTASRRHRLLSLPGPLHRLIQIYRRRRSIQAEPRGYLIALLLGGAFGLAAYWAFDWAWWALPMGLVLLVWLPSLWSVIWAPSPAALSNPTRGLLYVLTPRRAAAKARQEMEDVFRYPPWPLFGLPLSWQGRRFLGGHSESDKTINALQLAHGDPRNPDAPQLRVEVSEREEPLRFLAENLWHEARRPPEGLLPQEFAVWSTKQMIAIRTRPDPDWGHRTILVDGILVDFHFLGEGHSWLSRGRIGNVVLTLIATNFPVEDAALVKIADVEPYIQGGRDLAKEWRRPGAGPP